LFCRAPYDPRIIRFPFTNTIFFPPTLPFIPCPLSPPLLRPGNRALVFSFRPARSQIVRCFQYYDHYGYHHLPHHHHRVSKIGWHPWALLQQCSRMCVLLLLPPLLTARQFAFLIASCFFLTACRLWATKSSLLPITRIYSRSEY
jgi:hypothetical protein